MKDTLPVFFVSYDGGGIKYAVKQKKYKKKA